MDTVTITIHIKMKVNIMWLFSLSVLNPYLCGRGFLYDDTDKVIELPAANLLSIFY